MKKILMRAICFLMAIGYSGIVLAQAAASKSCGCSPSAEPKCQPPCRACEICPPSASCLPCCTEVPVIGEPCSCAYNAPARIDPLCGWDAWLSLSFIYWQANEKGLDLGMQVTGITNNVDYDVINMDFDYLPGFKIGAGMSFCRDNWTLYLEYTRLKSDDIKAIDLETDYSTDSPFDNLVSPWFNQLNTDTNAFKELNAQWDIDYDTFDLELGRPYYLGTKLIFKPHFGLRAGWLDQEYHIWGRCVPSIYVSSKSSQDTWFIGPRAGLDTDWLVGHDFRIFGNIAGSLVYQDFEIKNIQSTPLLITLQHYTGRDEFSTLTPNLEFSLGLGYGSYLCNSTWYFDLTVGYDFHYFWNQNMMRNLVDYLVDYRDHDSGDLKLHGLTITARLDF